MAGGCGNTMLANLGEFNYYLTAEYEIANNNLKKAKLNYETNKTKIKNLEELE